MIVRLTHPIPFNGGTIDQVTVRVPPEASWDANLEGTDNALWNLSNAVGLPVEVVTQFAEPDLEAIAAAFADVSSRWNVAASGAFTSHRAFRRRSNRR